MKFNNISYSSFSFIMVIFFPSMIFAPWSATNPPKQRPDDNLRTCAQWIQFNGFTLDNYNQNRNKARRRNHRLDYRATTWAAIYAFRISGTQDIYQFYPQEFCDSFGAEGSSLHEYKTLGDEVRNCRNWITLYRFRDEPNKITSNIEYARNLTYDKMMNTSVWATAYWSFLIKFGKKVKWTPLEFCAHTGKTVEEGEGLMSFMSDKSTELTCLDWIYLHEFTDVPRDNLNKALTINNTAKQYKYRIRLQYFPYKYAVKLINMANTNEPVDNMTPIEMCKEHDGEGPIPRKYNWMYKPPLDVCFREGLIFDDDY